MDEGRRRFKTRRLAPSLQEYDGVDVADNFLRSSIEDGRFFCSAELVLARDHTVGEAETFVREAAADPEGMRIISLTDLPGGNPALPPEAFASFVLEHGLTPLAHITGKDGNRSAVEARLHALARLGVENVLALTGDAQKPGYQGRARPVFDLDSVLILRLVRELDAGLTYTVGKRQARTTPFQFLPGAVVNPYKPREVDQRMQFYKLTLKAACGARFIITQIGFNLRKLVELKHYMRREEMGQVPLVANVYVPTAAVARMMQSGELAGCVVPDGLLQRLEKEKKPERLERASLMLAAVKDLGFAGAHVGGFGLVHRDFRAILDRAEEIGGAWSRRVDELVFERPGEFYLFPPDGKGLSDGTAPFRSELGTQIPTFVQAVSRRVHDLLVRPGSPGARFFSERVAPSGNGAEAAENSLWARLLAVSSLYRKATLGCVSCGDCIQDYAAYAGCTMRWCYKNLRNGPCGGSRPDGSCEADAALPCIWDRVYTATIAAGEHPARFGRTLVPPRDWSLDRSNALVNRYAGRDNYPRREVLGRS